MESFTVASEAAGGTSAAGSFTAKFPGEPVSGTRLTGRPGETATELSASRAYMSEEYFVYYVSLTAADKRKMVDDLNGINRQRYSASGAELVMGQGRFVGPKTIEVRLADGGTRILRGQTVAINTGTRAKIDAHFSGLLRVNHNQR